MQANAAEAPVTAPPTPCEKLLLVRRLEMLVAEVYAVLGQRFGDQRRATAFFTKLEQEALSRARRVQLLQWVLTRDEAVVAEIAVDAGRATCLTREATAIREALDETEAPIGCRHALALARRLERRLSCTRAQVLASTADAALLRLVDLLVRPDDASAEPGSEPRVAQ